MQSRLPDKVGAVAAECGLLEESRGEFVVLNFVHVLLSQSSFPRESNDRGGMIIDLYKMISHRAAIPQVCVCVSSDARVDASTVRVQPRLSRLPRRAPLSLTLTSTLSTRHSAHGCMTPSRGRTPGKRQLHGSTREETKRPVTTIRWRSETSLFLWSLKH